MSTIEIAALSIVFLAVAFDLSLHATSFAYELGANSRWLRCIVYKFCFREERSWNLFWIIYWFTILGCVVTAMASGQTHADGTSLTEPKSRFVREFLYIGLIVHVAYDLILHLIHPLQKKQGLHWLSLCPTFDDRLAYDLFWSIHWAIALLLTAALIWVV
jgi:hypothetical protein